MAGVDFMTIASWLGHRTAASWWARSMDTCRRAQAPHGGQSLDSQDSRGRFIFDPDVMIDLKEFKELEPNSTEWSILKDAYLLNHVWGVGEEDAKRAAISSMKASLFSGISPMKELGAKISAADMEEWMIDACRDEPHRANDYILKTEWVAKERYHKNPVEFYRRLARQLSRKSSMRDALLPANKWKVSLIWGWTLSTKAGIPPWCLWSDATVAALAPEGCPSNESAIRKTISRLGLYRPKSPCYGIEPAE